MASRWSTLLVRYVLSYISVLLIPFVFGIFLINDTMDRLEEQYMQKDKQAFQSTAQAFEKLFDSMDAIAYSIAKNDTRRISKLAPSAYTEMQLVALMSDYANINKMDYKTFLLDWNTDTVYDNVGKYDLDVFWPFLFPAGDLWADTGGWDQLTGPALFVRNHGGSQVFLYVYPLSFVSFARDDKQVYVVNYLSESLIQAHVSANLAEESGTFFIYKEGDVLYASGGQEAPDPTVWEDRNEYFAKAGAQWVYALRQRIRHFDYAYMYDTAPLDQKLSAYMQGNVLLSAAFLLVSFLVALVYSYRHYAPIRKAVRSLHIGGGQVRRDELNALLDGIMSIQAERQEAQNRVQEQREAMKNQCVRQVIGGIAGESTLKSLEEMGGCTDGQHVLMVLRAAQGEPAGSVSLHKHALEQSGMPGMVLVTELEEQEAMLVWLSDEGAGAAARQICGLLGDAGVCAGLSRTHPISMMHYAYLEAAHACNEALRLGRACVQYTQWEAEGRQGSANPELTLMLQAAEAGNQALVQELLGAILERLEAMNPVAQKCVRFEAINALRQKAEDLNSPLSSEQLIEIVSHEDLSTFRQEMTRLLADLRDRISRQNQLKSQLMAEQIIAFIDERFMAYDISTEQVAAAFSLSVNRLGRIVKDCTGRTPREYIIWLRMNRAHALLRDTGISIAEISDQIGYASVSHFIKTFRQQFGYSPGQCREMGVWHKGGSDG